MKPRDKRYIAIFMAFICWHTMLVGQNFGYVNPILPGMNPDPSVCRVGDDFYVITSSFIQYPGLPIYHSKDLIHWDMIGYCCTEDNGFDIHKGSGLYAPTIRYNEADSTFYVICTNMRNGGNFITYARNPAEKWSNLVWLKHPELHGIDPSLMFDKDGTCYFTATHIDGIIQAEVNPRTGEHLTEPRMIWGGAGGRYPEGPHLYHIGAWYYLILSEGGTEFGHHVVASRSNNPWGPFEECPTNPILSHVEKLAQSNPIQCTGHSDLVEAHDGSWWMVFLATRPNGAAYHLGRETFLAPVSWSRDNWPIVNGNGTVSVGMDVRTLPQTEAIPKSIRYELNDKTLPLEWNYYRHPNRSNYALTNGCLILKGEANNATFTGIRQRDFDFSAETCLTFNPAMDKEEAGLSVRHGQGERFDMGVVRERGRRYAISRFTFGHVNQVNKQLLPDVHGGVFLKVEGKKKEYTLYYSLDGKKWVQMGMMDSRFLAGGFSGLLVGVYATGNGQNSVSKAKFDYFDYNSKD